MQITVDPTIGDKGPWAERVGRANHILALIAGRFVEPPTARWALDQDHGRPVLVLTFSDDLGTIQARFTPEEMQDAEQLWNRLHRLWGDWLQDRSHKLLKRLQESLPPQGS